MHFDESFSRLYARTNSESQNNRYKSSLFSQNNSFFFWWSQNELDLLRIMLFKSSFLTSFGFQPTSVVCLPDLYGEIWFLHLPIKRLELCYSDLQISKAVRTAHHLRLYQNKTPMKFKFSFWHTQEFTKKNVRRNKNKKKCVQHLRFLYRRVLRELLIAVFLWRPKHLPKHAGAC